MKRAVLSLILFFWSLVPSYASPSQPRWDGTFNFTAIEKRLQNEKVISRKSMRQYLQEIGHKADFEGNVELVTLESGLLAVFKPYKPIDYPDAYAEVAAYKASGFLGVHLVPPVVLRKIGNAFGSLQFYVEPSQDALQYRCFEDILAQLPAKTVEDIKIFCFLFGQWDFGRHNIILQRNGPKIFAALIDNTGIKHHQKWRLGENPFVRVGYFETLNTNDWWGVPFPYEKAQTIDPDLKKIEKRFGNKLGKAFKKKLAQSAYPITYVLWRNSFWRQFHEGDPQHTPIKIAPLASDRREKIEKITEKVLNEVIFPHAQKADFYKPIYSADILARRDQLLQLRQRKD